MLVVHDVGAKILAKQQHTTAKLKITPMLFTWMIIIASLPICHLLFAVTRQIWSARLGMPNTSP
jgi:hypothetical protein